MVYVIRISAWRIGIATYIAEADSDLAKEASNYIVSSRAGSNLGIQGCSNFTKGLQAWSSPGHSKKPSCRLISKSRFTAYVVFNGLMNQKYNIFHVTT